MNISFYRWHPAFMPIHICLLLLPPKGGTVKKEELTTSFAQSLFISIYDLQAKSYSCVIVQCFALPQSARYSRSVDAPGMSSVICLRITLYPRSVDTQRPSMRVFTAPRWTDHVLTAKSQDCRSCTAAHRSCPSRPLRLQA